MAVINKISATERLQKFARRVFCVQFEVLKLYRMVSITENKCESI